MRIVYADGLSEEQFFESVQHIVNVVSMYASSGSGWINEKVEKLEIGFAKFNPIGGSTYIALPTELSAFKCLLNIRKFNDPNCFLYCFTAAYHLRGKDSHAIWGSVQQKYKPIATAFMFARTTKRFKNMKNFAINSKLVKFYYLSLTATVLLSKNFKQKQLFHWLSILTIIVPVSSVEQNPQTSGTRVMDKHIPSGYCYIAISHECPYLEFFHLYRGKIACKFL